MTTPYRPVSQLHDRVGAPPYVADHPDDIRAWQLITARGAVRLEAKGLRHSRLGPNGAKKLWAKHYGLSPRVKHEVVIARMTQEIELLQEKRNARLSQQPLPF
jgi:hypothetical protein